MTSHGFFIHQHLKYVIYISIKSPTALPSLPPTLIEDNLSHSLLNNHQSELHNDTVMNDTPTNTETEINLDFQNSCLQSKFF